MTLALIWIEARDCEPIAPRAAGAGAGPATSRTMTVAMRRRMMAGAAFLDEYQARRRHCVPKGYCLHSD
jgi:hypothetical protein